MDIFHSNEMKFKLLAAAALFAVMAGCSGGGGAGGALVVARVKDAIILDPAQATDGMSLNLTQEMMKGLVEFKLGTFDVKPAIAQRWTMSPDGRLWTFTLQHGLHFSDGTPIDAAAVKFNFDRWRLVNNPYHQNYAYGYYADMFGGFPGLIRNVTARDPYTVVFTLQRPFGPFLRDLAMPSFAIASPTAIRSNLPNFGEHPVGYGPYQLQEWVKDDHITLVADPQWRGIKPAYPTVIVRDIPDQATSVLEMQRGNLDFLTDPRPDDAKQLAKQSGLTVYQQPSNNVSYFAMNVQKAPFGNLLVRQAIAYAIDVPGIVKAFYAPQAIVASNFTPPGMLGYDPSLQTYPYNPAKAKQLLVQAGMSNGFTTDLYYPTTPRPYMPEPQRIAEAIQAQLKKIGINATLEPFEFGVFLDKVRNGEHQMCLIGWSGDNGDPDDYFYPLLDKDSALAKPNGQNYSFWEDDAFHALMLQGQATLQDAARDRIYRQANDMVHQQVPLLSIVHTPVPIVAKSSIAGFVPSPDTHIAFEYLRPR